MKMTVMAGGKSEGLFQLWLNSLGEFNILVPPLRAHPALDPSSTISFFSQNPSSFRERPTSPESPPKGLRYQDFSRVRK
jgi:hypothetical protein